MKLQIATLIGVLALAVPAEAQIYSWRDGNGHLVLSNVPREGAVPVATYAVPGAEIIRTTTKPASEQAATKYDDLIAQHAAAHGVSPALVRAVIQAESNFNPKAVSRKGAMGLMQLMPATARELGVDNPFQPEQNIRGGVRYLAQLLTRYNQNVELALAAYNAGPSRVDRYEAVPPFRETQAYVKKITGATRVEAPPPTVIYKWLELVNGRPTLRYSNVPPKHVPYEIVNKP